MDKLVDSYEKVSELYPAIAGILPDFNSPVVFISATKRWGLDKLKKEIQSCVEKLERS
ncbi:hypothetical protein [Desulfurobacterium crinifex]